jgi:hypothetical protein
VRRTPRRGRQDAPVGQDLRGGPRAAPARNPVGSWIEDSSSHRRASRRRTARTADAVAAAGYYLGGSSRRRAIVLIAGATRPGEHVLSSRLGRTGQTLVPLAWRRERGPRMGRRRSPGGSAQDRRPAPELDRQRIVWLEGHVDPVSTAAAGITIAGRTDPARRRAEPCHSRRRLAESSAVFAVTSIRHARDVRRTRGGLQISRDGGEHWSPVKTGADPGGRQSRSRGAGGVLRSSGAIGRASPAASWALAPRRRFSVLPSSKEMAFAATRAASSVPPTAAWLLGIRMEKTFASPRGRSARFSDLYAATAKRRLQIHRPRPVLKPAGRAGADRRPLPLDPASRDVVRGNRRRSLRHHRWSQTMAAADSGLPARPSTPPRHPAIRRGYSRNRRRTF